MNEIGHVVLELPIHKSEYLKCAVRPSFQRPFTLALESGYYVIRNSTFEEFHQQCIPDCKNEEECFFKSYPDDPVVFSWMYFDEDKQDFFSDRRYVSLFLNDKEVIDYMVSEITEYHFDRDQYHEIDPFIIHAIVKDKGYSYIHYPVVLRY